MIVEEGKLTFIEVVRAVLKEAGDSPSATMSIHRVREFRFGASGVRVELDNGRIVGFFPRGKTYGRLLCVTPGKAIVGGTEVPARIVNSHRQGKRIKALIIEIEGEDLQ